MFWVQFRLRFTAVFFRLSTKVLGVLWCCLLVHPMSTPIVKFHCPFVGLCGCQDGGGNGLTRSSLLTHLRDHHCNGDAREVTKQALTTNLDVFVEAETTFRRMGIWLCGVCFMTNTLWSTFSGGAS